MEDERCDVCRTKNCSTVLVERDNERIYCGECYAEFNNKEEKRRRKIMKQGAKTLFGLAAGAALTFAGFRAYNHYTSPDYQREKELDRLASYILPANDKEEVYQVGNDKIKVKNKYGGLEVSLNNKITFISEGWAPFPDDDARNLDELILSNQDGSIRLKKGEIQNFAEWQEKYEEIIRKTAEAKRAYLEKALSEGLK